MTFLLDIGAKALLTVAWAIFTWLFIDLVDDVFNYLRAAWLQRKSKKNHFAYESSAKTKAL